MSGNRGTEQDERRRPDAAAGLDPALLGSVFRRFQNRPAELPPELPAEAAPQPGPAPVAVAPAPAAPPRTVASRADANVATTSIFRRLPAPDAPVVAPAPPLPPPPPLPPAPVYAPVMPVEPAAPERVWARQAPPVAKPAGPAVAPPAAPPAVPPVVPPTVPVERTLLPPPPPPLPVQAWDIPEPPSAMPPFAPGLGMFGPESEAPLPVPPPPPLPAGRRDPPPLEHRVAVAAPEPAEDLLAAPVLWVETPASVELAPAPQASWPPLVARRDEPAAPTLDFAPDETWPDEWSEATSYQEFESLPPPLPGVAMVRQAGKWLLIAVALGVLVFALAILSLRYWPVESSSNQASGVINYPRITITAPVPGTVGQIIAAPGSTMNADQSMLLLNTADTSGAPAASTQQSQLDDLNKQIDDLQTQQTALMAKAPDQFYRIELASVTAHLTDLRSQRNNIAAQMPSATQYAPLSSSATSQPVTPGRAARMIRYFVTEGSSVVRGAALAEVGDCTALYAEAPTAQLSAAGLYGGDTVKVVLAGDTTPVKGMIDRVGPGSDQQSGDSQGEKMSRIELYVGSVTGAWGTCPAGSTVSVSAAD